MTDSSRFAERRQVGDPQRRVADGGTDPAAVVTEELTELGLTTYAARTFVALTCHGPSTAKEISSVADVPRTRVYDSVEELEQEGLAAVAGSDPLRFVATPPRQAVRVLRTRVRDRLTRLEAGLDDVAEGDTGGFSRVTQLDGADLISHHLVDAADESRSRLAYSTSSTVVDESVVDAVVAAANRGVDVTVLDPPPTVCERLEHEADTAAVTTYHTDTTGAVAERLVLADDDVAVVGLTDAGPDGTDDRAVGILGTGDRNALAVQLARWVTAVAATNDV